MGESQSKSSKNKNHRLRSPDPYANDVPLPRASGEDTQNSTGKNITVWVTIMLKNI